MHRRLETRVAGLVLEHPIMNASGVLGSTPEDVLELVKAGVSAVVTKSFTLEPREGHPTPVAVNLGYGWLNSVGLANPGAKALPSIVSSAKRAGKPVIVSIAAATPSEAAELAAVAAEAGADAIELNLSCPHARDRGLSVLVDEELAAEVVAEASAQGVPVLVKLGYTPRLVRLAERLLTAGAAAFTLVNTLPAARIDVWTRRPVLGGRVGGLSGRAIHPVAVRAVMDVHCTLGVDVVGVGGVYEWSDAVELILAGASAVQVASAIIEKGLGVVRELVKGIEQYLEIEDVSLGEIVGLACRA